MSDIKILLVAQLHIQNPPHSQRILQLNKSCPLIFDRFSPCLGLWNLCDEICPYHRYSLDNSSATPLPLWSTR
eukprot:508195-Karenia_brevis.AAC.1